MMKRVDWRRPHAALRRNEGGGCSYQPKYKRADARRLRSNRYYACDMGISWINALHKEWLREGIGTSA